MRRPIGTAAVGKSAQLVVICDDGTAWMWAPVPPKNRDELLEQESRLISQRPVDHTWIQFHTPIPGTAADLDYQEAAS